MAETEPRSASLHAYYAYRDADAALSWLGAALGFETTARFPDDRGGVLHAEVRRGDAALMVFTDPDGGRDQPPLRGETTGHGTFLSLATEADVDETFAAAVAAGSAVVWEPGATEWGNYRFRVLDPEGYEWTVGTLVPGLPAGDWSAEGGTAGDPA